MGNGTSSKKSSYVELHEFRSLREMTKSFHTDLKITLDILIERNKKRMKEYEKLREKELKKITFIEDNIDKLKDDAMKVKILNKIVDINRKDAKYSVNGTGKTLDALDKYHRLIVMKYRNMEKLNRYIRKINK